MTDHRDEHETYGHTTSPVIEDLRKQIATLLDEQTGFRVAIAQLTAERDEVRAQEERWKDDALRLMKERNKAEKERDEARRMACRYEASYNGVMFDNPKYSDILAIAKEYGWDCFKKEDGK